MEVLSLLLEDGTKDRLRKKFGFMSKPFRMLVEPVLEDRVLVLTDKKILGKIKKRAKKENRTSGAQATVMLRRFFNETM